MGKVLFELRQKRKKREREKGEEKEEKMIRESVRVR